MVQPIYKKKYRSSYTPPYYLISRINLDFELNPLNTIVTSIMWVQKNKKISISPPPPFMLNGEELELYELLVDEKPFKYEDINGSLVLEGVPDNFILKIKNGCRPKDNTSLSGLFISKNSFFTQCEAEGFRRITYFPDRPDILATYMVRITANKKDYPVLLSNGNLIDERDLSNGCHSVTWMDPFPKPSYLFALVAGKFAVRERCIKDAHGKEKILQIWVDSSNLPKTSHAMNALIKAINWDEKRFGLSLDLDRFMIVAVADFNMGAMENKGLNIFNSNCILADSQIATDDDFERIETVVAHEYFHNWTGNRVTCQSWFELTLKEGLTVFRDQEFTADQLAMSSNHKMSALSVKRIHDVRFLRESQFSEDLSPLAHSIRPESFLEINNLYTATVYEKGAEIVRMYQTLFGQDGFRKGLDLYLARHDGEAVTCDDFYLAMTDANNRPIEKFKNWYSQIGTPIVKVKTVYDAAFRNYSISLKQTSPKLLSKMKECFKQKKQNVLHIPFALGLLNSDGSDISLSDASFNRGMEDYIEQVKESNLSHGKKTVILELVEEEQTFQFFSIDFGNNQEKSDLKFKSWVPEKPVPSLLRGFSAPIIVEYDYSEEELYFLLANDSDPFNRWNIGHKLYMQIIRSLICFFVKGSSEISVKLECLANLLEKILTDDSLSPAYKNLMLTLPNENIIADEIEGKDPFLIHRATLYLKCYLAKYLKNIWEKFYDKYRINTPYCFNYKLSSFRSLSNLSLNYLAELDDLKYFNIASEHYKTADNLTDRIAALLALLRQDFLKARFFLEDFYEKNKEEPLAIDKWFWVQATQIDLPDDGTVSYIKTLMQHEAFNRDNPNRFRSLIFAFCKNNPSHFHKANGDGYAIVAEQVVFLDTVNPQLAASLVKLFARGYRYTLPIKKSVYSTLEDLLKKVVSRDVCDVVENLLAVHL